MVYELSRIVTWSYHILHMINTISYLKPHNCLNNTYFSTKEPNKDWLAIKPTNQQSKKHVHKAWQLRQNFICIELWSQNFSFD